MGYRDEREALRQRGAALEQELAEARQEIETLRGRLEGRPLPGSAAGGAEAQRSGLEPRNATARLGSTGGGTLLLFALGLVFCFVGLEALLGPVPATLAVALLVVALLATRLVHIAPPDQALVLCGRRRRTADGREVGYRVVRGGRALRMPLVEQAKAALDLGVFVVRIPVRQATTRDGSPLDVDAEALVKVSSRPALLANAAERFADVPRVRLEQAAQQTLEGTLREAVAKQTARELCEDRDGAARHCIESGDLEKLGLEALGLWIVRVNGRDLESQARERAAHVLRDAEVAEARRRQQGGA